MYSSIPYAERKRNPEGPSRVQEPSNPSDTFVKDRLKSWKFVGVDVIDDVIFLRVKRPIDKKDDLA